MGTTPYSFMKSCRLFAAIRALAVFIQRRTTFRAKAGFGAGRCFGFDRGADRLGCRLCRSSFLNDRFCRRFLHRRLRSRLCRNRFLNRGCFYRSLCLCFHRCCFRSRFGRCRLCCWGRFFCRGLCCRSRFLCRRFCRRGSLLYCRLCRSRRRCGLFRLTAYKFRITAVFGFLSTVF